MSGMAGLRPTRSSYAILDTAGRTRADTEGRTRVHRHTHPNTHRNNRKAHTLRSQQTAMRPEVMALMLAPTMNRQANRRGVQAKYRTARMSQFSTSE